ncbi:MAG: DUF2778 domain-containing protein [Bacteroidales bacterium]|nr:DUF2778 domain-containing protein [Bacteroidales bacterium]
MKPVRVEDVYYCLGVPVQADYDPQIGRWHVTDPANQYFSPYLAMGNNPVNSIDPTGCENIGGFRIPWDGYQRMAAFHQAYQDWLNNGGKGLFRWSYGDGKIEPDQVDVSGGNSKVQFYYHDGKIIAVDSGEGWLSDGFKAVNDFLPINVDGSKFQKAGGQWGYYECSYSTCWIWDPVYQPIPIKTVEIIATFHLKSPNSTGGNLSLLYNGQRLFVVNEDKGSVVYSTKVTSGRGEYMNNPNAQNIPKKGPIPRGNYTFQNTQWQSQSTLRQVYNIIAGNGDWGDYNVPLAPVVPGSRDGFYLHGGFFEGSGGCIDAGGNIGIIYNYLMNQETTILRVRY